MAVKLVLIVGGLFLGLFLLSACILESRRNEWEGKK